jgi:hypothetical protein
MPEEEPLLMRTLIQHSTLKRINQTTPSSTLTQRLAADKGECYASPRYGRPVSADQPFDIFSA